MPRKDAKTVNFQPNDEELKILEAYCDQEGRTKSDVLRELVRGLKRRLKNKE